MDDQPKKVTLEELDLFKLLGLSHLTPEEREGYTNELLEGAFSAMAAEDLPLYMTEEDIDEFNKLSADPATKPQAMEFLKQKFPDFDDYVRAKLLAMKKDLVKANFQERLDILNTAPDEAEKARVQSVLTAIDQDDWATVASATTA